MKLILLRVALCVALVGLNPKAHAEGESDEALIVPGKSIGKAELGPFEQITKVLGRESFGEGAMGRAWSIWYGKPGADGKADSSMVYSHRDEIGKDQAVQIAVTSAFFHTSKGVATNSDLAAIWQEFPELKFAGMGNASHNQEDMELYDDINAGITFAVEHVKNPESGQPWGRCRAVMVHEAGRAPYFYVPRREVPWHQD